MSQMDEDGGVNSGQLCWGSDDFGRFIPVKTRKQTHTLRGLLGCIRTEVLHQLLHILLVVSSTGYLLSGWRSCWVRKQRMSLLDGSLDCWPCRWDSIIQSYGRREQCIQNITTGLYLDVTSGRTQVIHFLTLPVRAVTLHWGHVRQTLSLVRFTRARATWRDTQHISTPV